MPVVYLLFFLVSGSSYSNKLHPISGLDPRTIGSSSTNPPLFDFTGQSVTKYLVFVFFYAVIYCSYVFYPAYFAPPLQKNKCWSQIIFLCYRLNKDFKSVSDVRKRHFEHPGKHFHIAYSRWQNMYSLCDVYAFWNCTLYCTACRVLPLSLSCVFAMCCFPHSFFKITFLMSGLTIC